MTLEDDAQRYWVLLSRCTEQQIMTFSIRKEMKYPLLRGFYKKTAASLLVQADRQRSGQRFGRGVFPS